MMRLKFALAILALSLATLSAPAAPALAKEQDKPEPARVYKDWVVGCESAYSCEAVTLRPDGRANGYNLNLSFLAFDMPGLRTQLRLHDPKAIVLDQAKGPYKFTIDGKIIGDFIWREDEGDWYLAIDRWDSVLLAKGKNAQILDKNGQLVSLISLSGATAAMRDMDERFFGGYSLFETEFRPYPVQGNPYRPSDPPPLIASMHEPPPSIIESAIVKSGCAALRNDGDAQHDAVHSLPNIKGKPSLALILVGCGRDGSNQNVAPLYAVWQSDGSWILSELTIPPSIGGLKRQSVGIVSNAVWDEKKLTLKHTFKTSELGDCGTSMAYRFIAYSNNTVTFIKSKLRDMPVCRGATYWPRIW